MPPPATAPTDHDLGMLKEIVLYGIYFIEGLFNSQEKLVVDKIFILAHQIAYRLGMIF